MNPGITETSRRLLCHINLMKIRVDRIVWPIITLLIAGTLRLYHLGAQSLWYDESYTVLVGRLPFKLGLEFLMTDGVHPPLYYLIDKGFLGLVDSEWFVRLPSVIFGVFGVVAIYLVTDEWLGQSHALLAGLLLALSPFHLWYSQDARMYTLLALFSIVSMGGYLRLLNRPSPSGYSLFTIANALAYLTHYFALFLPLIQFIHLTINLRRYPRQLRIWTALQVIASLPFLVWIYLVLRQPGQSFGIGWIPRPEWRDLLLTLVNFTIGYFPPIRVVQWTMVGGMLLLLLFGLRHIWSNNSLGTLLILWAFLPPLIIFALSYRLPTYVDRYFILSLPAFFILLSIGVVRLGKRWGIAAGIIILMIFAWRSSQILNLSDTLTKEQWRQAAAYLQSNVGNDEIVIPRVYQILVPFHYYLREELSTEAMEFNRQVTPLSRIVDGYRGAWLVYWNATTDAHILSSSARFDPDKEENPVVSAWISGDGPEERERVDFPGITIYHFALSP